jgi:hypothetical protein
MPEINSYKWETQHIKTLYLCHLLKWRSNGKNKTDKNISL